MKDILDTNVLIRFLVADSQKQHEQSKLWFKEAEEGRRVILITPVVVAEVSFVLEGFYKREKEEIAIVLESFLAQKWLEVYERDVLLGLWGWYRQGLHFVDSFLLSWARLKGGNVLTFDKQIEKKK